MDRPEPNGRGTKIKLAIGALAIAVLVGLNLVYGRWGYDRAFAKIEKGMTRAQVVTVMGKPDKAFATEKGECLGFEAVEKWGKRSSAKHTFYLVWLQSDRVMDTSKLSQEALQALMSARAS